MAIHVLLPAAAAHLASLVRDAGGVPVVDATGAHPPAVPDGAWVRIRPGKPAPGTGPVVLAEFGAPVPDRPTWLETAEPHCPPGFAGIILKGREAGGACAEVDALSLLATAADRSKILVDAGCGPRVTAAVAAMGAGGVFLVEPHLACPEIGLPPGLSARLDAPDAEATRIVAGLRVCAAATAPVLRQLASGADPWKLAENLWQSGDARTHLWMIGQGIALARGLSERHGGLRELIKAYVKSWNTWPRAVRRAQSVPSGLLGSTAAHLRAENAVASGGGSVGTAVLWEEATWLSVPIGGGPLEAALAIGTRIAAPQEALDEVRAHLLANAPDVDDEVTSEVPMTSGPAIVPDCAPDEVHETGRSNGGGAIAIIGMGGRFPGANSVPEFWDMLLRGESAIGPVPPERWDPNLYFDSDPGAPDKTYSAIGGFLRGFVFEPKKFRIPPKVSRQIDPVQQITLASVADALEDANLQVDAKSPGRPFDRARCAVILGNSLGGEVKDEYAKRLAWPEMERAIRATPEIAAMSGAAQKALFDGLEREWKRDLPEVDEDSMPGELSNVIAGRIANAFDLAGANFTVDAACASSMAAIQAACKGLQDGDFDIALTGGADRSMNISTYVKFCKIGALSPDHSSPFDASANGFVMGEGAGILVLKRFEDAVRDGDRVYAVIRGIGASSDGKGKGITAPNKQGQLRALERAYGAAGIDPASVDLMECHGTSTVVGDKIEIEALSEFVGPGKRGARGPMRIGSVKSNIGHLKSAAGAAAVIKAAMALFTGQFPPSINYGSARPDVPLDTVPLRVQTQAESWPANGAVRRAGVSSFGFGGTNFHIVMEAQAGQSQPVSHASPPTTIEYPPMAAEAAPQAVVEAPPVAAPAAQPIVEVVERAWPDGLWCTSANDREQLAKNLRALLNGGSAPWHASAPLRIAAAADSVEERTSQLERALKTVEKGGNPDILRARGIAFEDAPFDGKLAMLFTGQGSQYLDMGLDLAAAYPLVQQTFDEADRILTPQLGRPITDYIRLRSGEDAAAKEDLLRQTEYSQPATLTVDIAILRLLASYGVRPDLVAGHSLGEYAACVAAGIMTFEQALLAVSARGREMAAIKIDDPGKMAGIAASTEAVEEVLADVQGYVIAANKNCPSQTVIAGASDAVDEACERFKAAGTTVYMLPVSHAFHSAIVAPASGPLRGVLAGLGLKPPVRPITTNVTSEYYPSGPGAIEAIIDLLARQISSPVEWTAQIERMHDDGARIFMEVGPKRALTGFVVSTLKRRPHRALYTNHPKRGGAASFRDSLAGLLVAGVPLRIEPQADFDLLALPEPKIATTEAVAAHLALHETEAMPDVKDGILMIVARRTGYHPKDLDLDFELEADLGIDTVKQAEIFSVVRSEYGIPADPTFSFADHKTLRSVIEWATKAIGARRSKLAPKASLPAPALKPAPVAEAAPIASAEVIAAFLSKAADAGIKGMDGAAFANALLPAVQGLLAAAFAAAKAATPPPAPVQVKAAPVARAGGTPAPTSYPPAPTSYPPAPTIAGGIVCSGASIGLPGGSEVFAADNVAAILAGQNRISNLGDRAKKFLELGIVRLHKDPKTGEGTFQRVESESEVIHLAGTRSDFDPRAYGLPADLVRALDITSQLAMAAGIEALRDAGIPLVRAWKETASGKKAPHGYLLPEALRDDTGVIFASAFPGYDQLVGHLEHHGDDGEGRFDRRLLFQILSMGHAQMAQFIGARGPNTAINAACASTTQAVVMAHDWIRLGRCKRVLVVAADDVTNERLMPWIGGGFLASGAATTKDVVEEAALPFDARRHGMILGMGAAGFVIETAASAAERGTIPLAELLGTAMANSAFHGTRLDPPHIAQIFTTMVNDACARHGLTPARIAASALFMSHETYTPARGGSAAAEIAALRAAFGADAQKITIANTKGFTGHPMGAGIEDAIALKAMQYDTIPPVANFRDPDPELGDLRISNGEKRPVEFAVRLSAGFGSQLALTMWKRIARGEARVTDAKVREAWLVRVGGSTTEEIVDRTLRLAGDGVAPAPAPAPAPALAGSAGGTPAPTAPAKSVDMLAELLTLVAQKTGYSKDELDPDFELEADLGIDTVKQAEIFSALRERHGLARDDGFRLVDFPTLRKLAGYLDRQLTGGAPAPAEPAKPAPKAVVPVAPKPAPTARPDMLAELVAVVAQKTGYAPAELDPDFELEADLGIDTVKQAEIFSLLREKHGLQRDDGFKLADYPTLRSLAGWLSDKAGEAQTQSYSEAPTVVAPSDLARVPVMAPPVAPVAALAPVASQADREARALADLVAIVAEKTGYAPHELDPDFELEADLGVDTVKQAEIFSDLRDRYKIQRDDSFKLADHPSIRSLASWLAERMPADLPAAPPAEDDDEHTDDAVMVRLDELTGTSSHGSSAADAPADVAPHGDEGGEFDLGIVDRPGEQAARLPASFRIRRPMLVERPVGPTSSLEGQRILVLGADKRADAIRKEVVARKGLLAPPWTSVIDAGDDVLSSFRQARELAASRPERWVTVTRLGDFEGIVPLERAFADGARAGFAKALAREWDGVHVRVLGIQGSEEEAAQAALDELGGPIHKGGGAIEVFRKGGERRTVAYATEALPRSGELYDAPVVLLTGGARGITAKVAMELARRGPIRLALVGRGPMAEAPTDLDAAREEIKAAMKATGNKVAPAEVDRRLDPVRRAEEARRTVAELEEKGAEVRYFRCDLADESAIADMLNEVEESLGPVDIVVHGAGVEESRLIADKDQDAFDRVFNGKARGGLSLLKALGAEVYFISMGSVAGRFGNAGQVDYSAANDALARVCLTRPRSLHVDWTAWDDVGMAVRGGMKSLLTDRGVDLLPAEPGAALLVDLVAAGTTGEIVVAGRLGGFSPVPDHPMLDRIEQDGDIARGFCTLLAANEPWLRDHAIDGTPVLPGVIGIELMAATAAAALPGRAYVGARRVKFDQPLKVHKDEPVQVTIEARPVSATEVRCKLTSERRLKTGRMQRTEHFSATILLGDAPAVDNLPNAFLPDEVVDRAGIYSRFFHGPKFQVLDGADGVALDGLAAAASFDPHGISEFLLTEPLALEAAFQAAGLHRMIVAGEMALPSVVDSVIVSRAAPLNERVSLLVAFDGDAYHIDVDGPDGPILRVRGFKMIERGPLPPGQRFEEPEGGRFAAFGGQLKIKPASTQSRASADENPLTVLSYEEIGAISMRGTERRVRDRLAGRIAAKRALVALTGVPAAQIRVVSAPSGEPVAQVPGHPDVAVSISHRDGHAIAVAVAGGRIGVDLERVESRPSGFADDWLRPEERIAAAGDAAAITVIWAVKEAVLKALGRGMALSPRDIEVAIGRTGSANVTLHGEAARAHAELGGGPIRAQWEVAASEVVATVRIAA